MTSSKPIVVMIAGQPRKGKSTALNNLFGVNFDTKPSPRSVTLEFTPTTVSKGDIDLIVIDTPGMEAIDIDTQIVMKDIDQYVRGLDFTLLYCLSVSICDSVTEADHRIVQVLLKHLHKHIWSKCLLLLTFADFARGTEDYKDDQNYIEFLQGHSLEFQKVLRQNGLENKVKTIFDFKREGSEDIKLEDMNFGPRDIIAVPVTKIITRNDIMPGVNLQDLDNWTELVYSLLMKKVEPMERLKYLDFKYSSLTTAAGVFTGVGIGSAVGAGVGAGIGVLGGPQGIPVGAGIGAGVGGIIGIIGGNAIDSVIRYKKWKKINPDKKLTQIMSKIKEDEESNEAK